MSTALVPVPFAGDTLYVSEGETPYAAVKPICDALGIDRKSQQRRLNDDPERWGGAVMTLPSPGGGQQTLCLPLYNVPAWLMTIQRGRVRPALRDKLLRYQTECARALWDYWTTGAAVNPRRRTAGLTPAETMPLLKFGKRFKLAYDPEVKAFVDSVMWTLTIDDLRAAVVGRFGEERSPGRSSLHRYRQWSRDVHLSARLGAAR